MKICISMATGDRLGTTHHWPSYCHNSNPNWTLATDKPRLDVTAIFVNEHQSAHFPPWFDQKNYIFWHAHSKHKYTPYEEISNQLISARSILFVQ